LYSSIFLYSFGSYFYLINRDVKILDRTAVILEIFAQHAQTREGQLQVRIQLHCFDKNYFFLTLRLNWPC
jgi:hypothetical protein